MSRLAEYQAPNRAAELRRRDYPPDQASAKRQAAWLVRFRVHIGALIVTRIRPNKIISVLEAA